MLLVVRPNYIGRPTNLREEQASNYFVPKLSPTNDRKVRIECLCAPRLVAEMQGKLKGLTKRMLNSCVDTYVHGGVNRHHFPQTVICGTCIIVAQKMRAHRRSGVHDELDED